jgi:hypothetical protein
VHQHAELYCDDDRAGYKEVAAYTTACLNKQLPVMLLAEQHAGLLCTHCAASAGSAASTLLVEGMKAVNSPLQQRDGRPSLLSSTCRRHYWQHALLAASYSLLLRLFPAVFNSMCTPIKQAV